MPSQNKLENLRLAQSILVEIRRLANAEGEEFLTYLIDIACSEAADRIHVLEELAPPAWA